MKILLSVLVAFLLSACGLAPWAGSPPTFTLESKDGDQNAVQGSYCIDRGGRGECNDYPAVFPKEVTVVAAGDEVSFVMAGAAVVRSSRCHSETEQDCIGWVMVRPLGCEGPDVVESVPLAVGHETHWTVDLDPGAYQLDVFSHFASSGASGDVSGSLGLVVAENPATVGGPGVLEVQPSMQVCPFDVATE